MTDVMSVDERAQVLVTARLLRAAASLPWLAVAIATLAQVAAVILIGWP